MCIRQTLRISARVSGLGAHAQSLKSRLSLCQPMDSSPPGSFVHGILQATVLEWVNISFSRDLPDPGIGSILNNY